MKYFVALVISFCSLVAFGQAPGNPGGNPEMGQPMGMPGKLDAQKGKQKKQPKIRVPKEEQHINKTVYMFGVSTQLGDSVQYITSACQIDGADLTKKTQFLTYRESYSYQLRAYLEGTLNKKSQTTAIYFDTKQKRLQKRYSKMINKILKQDGVKLVTINPEEFIFSSIEATLQQ